MSEPFSALLAAEFQGYATVREAGLHGMVTLRADLSDTRVMKAVKMVAGIELPGVRRVTHAGDKAVGWMSPDELLILCPYAEAPSVVARLTEQLSGTHHLAADVSDARAVFRLEGQAAREVLAKLTPTDLAPGKFEPGELRRTRLAQVPAAFWMDDTGFTVVAFRSVAQYVFDLLKVSATPGGEVGLWA